MRCRKNLPLYASGSRLVTLSRKRSSPIHVDGIDYRWAVSAQRIVVTVPHRDRYLNMDGPPPPEFNYDAITPSLVRKIMAAAINEGWVPDRPGPELAFDLQPDETVTLR